jgi:hypothetical protein
MNLVCNISDFDIEKMFFLDIKKNIIIDGTFTKIIYSTSNVIFNGIYLLFPIIGQSCELNKKNTNVSDTSFGGKYYISTFSILNKNNINIIKELNRIEHSIIEYAKDYFNINKINVYSLRNQLKHGNIKIYNSHYDEPDIHPTRESCIIKISGIWENDQNIGITYKFLNI